MTKKDLFIMILLMIFFAFNAEGQSQVYKYVDKNGVAHFTNAPADPRYRPASRLINLKGSKKHKDLKPRRHSESKAPQNVKKLKNPLGYSN
jgi:hypothetical protein